MKKTAVKKAVDTLVDAFAEDPMFRYAWQANIAMAFVDDVRWYKEKTNKRHLSRQEIHEIANVAADRFLQMLERRPNMPNVSQDNARNAEPTLAGTSELEAKLS